jgi:RNA polymerase sigma-70 factor (ECF subfamily)
MRTPTFNKLCKLLAHMGTTRNMDLSNPATFARAYDEHAGAVYGAALRVLGNPAAAQDVAQDVFLRLWRRPGAFDSRRGDLGAYLRLMARSRALDLWRTAQAGGRATDRLKIASGRDEPRPEEQPAPNAERDEDRRSVRAALQALPASQREAVVLAYWGGLTASEIAARSGVPIGTAKSRVRLGLQRMRAELGGETPAAALVEAA